MSLYNRVVGALVAATAALSGGCEAAVRYERVSTIPGVTQSEVAPPPPAPLVRATDSVTVPWGGGPRRGTIDALYRAFAAQSFEIDVHDPSTGVLRVARAYQDDDRSRDLELRRQYQLNGLTTQQRAYAFSTPNRLSVPAWVQRRFEMTVVIGDAAATVTPRVVSCVVSGNAARECGEEVQLNVYETEVVDYTVALLAAAGGASDQADRANRTSSRTGGEL